MKKLLYFIAVVGMIMGTNSCKKEGGNPLQDINNLAPGSYITLNSNINLNLNYAALATSTVGIKVDQYLTPGTTSSGDVDVDKIKVYVVKGINSTASAWKLVKTVTYSGPGTSITCTGQELATALGVSIGSLAAGDYYTFYNQIVTKSGAIYDINNTGTSLASLSSYNAAFSFTAYIVCPFSAPIAGTYRVIRDDWADWNPGDLVQVTDGPGTNQINLTKVWPGVPAGGVPANANSFLVNIDAATGTAKVPLQTIGGYGGSTQYTVQGANGSDVAGYVFSCTGYITLSCTIKSNGGSNYGVNKLILQK
jgi:hypothetical protein